MKAAVCTIVAKNYLAQARVLMESVRLCNPDLLRIVILVDRIDGYFDPAKEPFDLRWPSHNPDRGGASRVWRRAKTAE